MTGDEQTNSQENEQPAAQASPPSSKNHEERSQWIKFGILAIILLGVIAVVALVRPLIFGHVVPAVMGDTQPPAAEPTAASPDAQENEVFIPAASGGGPEEAATPVEDDVQEAEGEGEGETAVTPPPPDPTAIPATPVTHTVQTGDNLTKIAQQYGVTVQEIITANNLANGDYISVGQILIIPVSQ